MATLASALQPTRAFRLKKTTTCLDHTAISRFTLAEFPGASPLARASLGLLSPKRAVYRSALPPPKNCCCCFFPLLNFKDVLTAAPPLMSPFASSATRPFFSPLYIFPYLLFLFFLLLGNPAFSDFFRVHKVYIVCPPRGASPGRGHPCAPEANQHTYKKGPQTGRLLVTADVNTRIRGPRREMTFSAQPWYATCLFTRTGSAAQIRACSASLCAA